VKGVKVERVKGREGWSYIGSLLVV